MNEDLEGLSGELLLAEVKKLREGIRQHRDSMRHDLCWHHPIYGSYYPPLPSIGNRQRPWRVIAKFWLSVPKKPRILLAPRSLRDFGVGHVQILGIDDSVRELPVKTIYIFCSYTCHWCIGNLGNTLRQHLSYWGSHTWKIYTVHRDHHTASL